MWKVIALVAVARVAAAEPPGLSPVGAPRAYPTPVLQLTDDEQDLIDTGYISGGQTAGGVMLSLMGFGLGQAVEGRWHDTGYIFTYGELASITGMVVGAASGGVDDERHHSGANLLFVASVVAFLGLHVWEVGDAAIGPASHNRRVYDLRVRAGLEPYVAMPMVSGTGGVAGLSLRF